MTATTPKPDNHPAKFAARTANTYRSELATIRRQRDGLLAEIRDIELAPLPLPDVIARIEAIVEDNKEIHGLDSLFMPGYGKNKLFTAEVTRDTRVPQYVVNDMVVGQSQSHADLAPLLCGLFGNAIKTTLVEAATRLAEHYVPGHAMKARPGLIKDLEAQIYALEVEEEALIWAARQDGITGIGRRPDLNPEIVLMMEA